MRLDLVLQKQHKISRSQASNIIRMGKVQVDGRVATKPGQKVYENSVIEVDESGSYVSRAGNKLASVAEVLYLNFKDKVVLDVGSSTGGFTDYALQNGAKKIIAVDVGTDQLHPSLRGSEKIELHEKTDIRDFKTNEKIDIVVIDVSFISLREILPSVEKLANKKTQIVAMLKPQFESGSSKKHKGVIKNSAMRRQILKDFELWSKNLFVIKNKQDSQVSGRKGNVERFYLLQLSR